MRDALHYSFVVKPPADAKINAVEIFSKTFQMNFKTNTQGAQHQSVIYMLYVCVSVNY